MKRMFRGLRVHHVDQAAAHVIHTDWVTASSCWGRRVAKALQVRAKGQQVLRRPGQRQTVLLRLTSVTAKYEWRHLYKHQHVTSQHLSSDDRTELRFYVPLDINI